MQNKSKINEFLTIIDVSIMGECCESTYPKYNHCYFSGEWDDPLGHEEYNIIKKTKILPNYINVGGGFPTIYPDLIPQSIANYFNEIKKSLENLKLNKLPEIICEPGRALVAESGSTIVRVSLRKKQKLYINDGTYGTLFDAGTPNIVFPSKMIKENSNKIISKKLTAFDFLDQRVIAWII